jgi:hypothetical protein
MRFEVSHRGGVTHQVDLPAAVAVIGRDPGCDVVLNDTRCSRRHAVVEDRPEGLVIRDMESANGTFVNGKRVERALLRAGDTIRLGDTRLKVLADAAETVIVGPEDLEPGTVPPSPRPPRPARPPEGVADAVPVAVGRPPTVTLLAARWALFAPASAVVTLLAARRLGGGALTWGLAAAGGVALAGLGIAMSLGLRALAPWARTLQVGIAALGLLACPFALASATVLLYLARPEVKAAFEGRGVRPRDDEKSAEATFALSLLAMLALGVALAAIGAFALGGAASRR